MRSTTRTLKSQRPLPGIGMRARGAASSMALAFREGHRLTVHDLFDPASGPVSLN